ncbi:ABC transporter ATP-binding protein [Kineococcus sp. SYSU DK001]|uniref:ABC transporter ATP-binding protein n=1 Tax=Kineococcus sp. SYSU DK001 TaxID=3383122 RepID=UPI003D7E7958
MSAPTLSPNPSRDAVRRTVSRFARPHAAALLGAVALGVLASLATAVFPVVVGRVTDALLAGDRDAVLALGLVGVGLAVAQTVLATLSRARLARAGEHLVRDVRDEVAHGLATTPLRFLDAHPSGELLQRSTAEVAELSGFVRESLTELLVRASTVVLFVVVLAAQSWELTAVLLVVFAPPALLVTARFRSRAADRFGAEAQAEADVAAGVAETIRVRALLRTAPAATRARTAARDAQRDAAAVTAQMRTAALSRWVNAMSLVEGLTLVVLIVAGAWLAGLDRVSVGVVVTFVLASVTLFSSTSDLVALVGPVEETLTGVARVGELLEATGRRTPMPAPAPVPVPAQAARGPVTCPAVELTGVTFGYGDEPVLTGVDLRLERGARCGIAGPSGAGKSTLAALLAGLRTPASGTVRCAGSDPAALGPAERAARVAFVPQEVVLGSGTLADELRLVLPGADGATLREAFARLGVGRWLDGLPEGLDTPLGEGSTLTAGERQLVGLARVALRDSEVLVLDEATSDVDPATAELLERAIDSLTAGRTVVVVAHREATLARLGEVHDLTGGRLVRRAR